MTDPMYLNYSVRAKQLLLLTLHQMLLNMDNLKNMTMTVPQVVVEHGKG